MLGPANNRMSNQIQCAGVIAAHDVPCKVAWGPRRQEQQIG